MDLNLPYITKDLEGIGGKIKENSRFFVVEEIPLYKPSGEGEHLYINLTRKEFTTKEIQKKLSDLFDLNPKKIGFAGLKDKYALTTQTFSLMLGKLDQDSIKEVVSKINKNLPIVVNWAKLHNNKLRVGHLLGNKFTIFITDLKIPQNEALKKANIIIRKINEIGLPNFFGEQRFGINGNNIQKGLDIIKGKNNVKDKWLRRFLVSSYQSYLCNRYLTRRIEKDFFDKILKGDVAKKYDTGGLFLVEDNEKEQPRYDKKEISFTAPIYGYKMLEAQGISKELEDSILKKENITLDELKKARGTRRLGKVIINDINIEKSPKGLEVNFSLPKGAFATILMREIMKN